MLSAREIYLTKSLKINTPKSDAEINAGVASFNRNLECLGFTMHPELLSSLSSLSISEVSSIYREVVPTLKKMTGAHRVHEPMYPNFPRQVMEASDLELYLNAITHYFVAWVGDVLNVPARWLPSYQKEGRESLPADEISLNVIKLGSDDDFGKIFTRLVGSNGSLSQSDKDIVLWFVDNKDIKSLLPESIPQKENLTFLVGNLMPRGMSDCLLPYLKTATDVLRVAVVMSEGDASLAKPCKFRRFKRHERRFFLKALENINATEDMLRRPEIWKRLGHELHPGDYSATYPNTYKAFQVVRNDEPFETFNGKVESVLKHKDLKAACELLKSRPGDFARRLDHMFRLCSEDSEIRYITGLFVSAAAKVSTPVLMQLMAHLRYRLQTGNVRSFFPKGNVAKVQVADALPKLPGCVTDVPTLIREILVTRFRSLPSLGKVYLDEQLKTQFVPFAQRSASKSLRTISRGSRMPLPDCDTLRFFVWWKDGESRTDIDLAAAVFGDKWNRLGEIAYYNLREWGSAHSGDITSAPNGAAEFIDIHIPTVMKNMGRYVAMVIYSFTQQAFKDLPECFAGWMARKKVQSGEVFEARTVKDKIDIAGDTTVNIPLFFDLETRQMIWSDIALKNRNPINNTRKNGNTLALMGQAMSTLQKPTLYDLFWMHGTARGEFVNSPEEADTVFSMDRGTTPFDTDVIMSEYMK